MKELSDILRLAETRRDQPFALATLVRARGSSYRRPGARMLVCSDGATAGSLSGGCLEEEVAHSAFEVLRTGTPTLMNFDTRLRFGCNGSIEVFVERVGQSFLSELSCKITDREPFRIVTNFEEKSHALGSQITDVVSDTSNGGFIHEIAPPLQLLIYGDGPDSGALCSFARNLGWAVIEADQPGDIPADLDAHTAAIVKSHNYGRDFAALRLLLPMNLRYVGLLGPRRRRDQLISVLLDEGCTINSELFAPAGLDLGAETPEEIALAIVAEIQAVFADGSGDSLRDRKTPIHATNAARAESPIEQWALSPR